MPREPLYRRLVQLVGTTQGSVVRATWLALLQPKRLVPIVLVCGALVFAQASWSSDRLAVPLAVVMCLCFVGLAPVSYRVLFPDGLDFSHGAVRVVLYAIVSAGAVLSVGVAVPKLLDMGPTFLSDRSSLLVSMAMFIAGGWGLGRDIGFEQRMQTLEREAQAAQLLAIKAHLDPHFLFNTLNALAEWCRTDGVVAEAAVLKLSALLRAVLEGVKAPTWSLEQELKLVRDFFELHRLRDAGLFTVVEQLPGVLPAVEVPPMALLTLAENAVKHGPGKGHRGELLLQVEERAGAVVVAVENPGPFGGPRKGSDGVPMLERRLKLLFGAQASLLIGARGDGRTRAELSLPRRA